MPHLSPTFAEEIATPSPTPSPTVAEELEKLEQQQQQEANEEEAPPLDSQSNQIEQEFEQIEESQVQAIRTARRGVADFPEGPRFTDWDDRPRLRWTLSDVVTMAVSQAPQIEIDRMTASAALGRLLASYDLLTPQFEAVTRYAERRRLLNQFLTDTLGEIRSVDRAGLDGITNPIDDPATENPLDPTVEDDVLTAFELLGPIAFEPRGYFENIRNSRVEISQVLPWGTQIRLSALELQVEDTFTTERTLTGIPLSPIFPRQQDLQVSLTLVQPLWRDFGRDATMAEIRIRNAEFQAADATFLGQIDAYLAQVAREYMRLSVLGKAVEAQKSAVNASRELLDLTADLYEEGLTDAVEVARQRTAVSVRQNAYWRAQSAFFDAQNLLLGLLLPEYEKDKVEVRVLPATPMHFSLPDNLDPDFHIAETMARSESVPRIATALADVNRAQARSDLLLNEAKPRLDFTASFGYRGLGGDMGGAVSDLFSADHPEWLVGLTFSMPLGPALSDGREAEARAGMVQAEESLRRVRLEVSLRIENTLQECRLAHVRIAEAQQMTEDAAEAVRVETLRLEAGQTVAHQVQELRSELLFAQLRALEAEFDFQNAYIDFLLAKGRIMETLNVVIDEPQGLRKYRSRPTIPKAVPVADELRKAPSAQPAEVPMILPAERIP